MGAAEDVVIGRDDEIPVEAAAGLGLIEVVHMHEGVDVGYVEGILAVFDLLGEVDLPIGVPAVPVDVPDGADVLKEHNDALEAVGQLHGDRIEGKTAGLLEVGVLGDLEPVEPHLPAEAPGAESGTLPVILDEADVVLVTADAQGVEALQVDLLGVAGIGLQDDLKLGVHLHAVGVVAETAVVGAVGRLDVGDVPGLRAQDAEHGGRVHRPGADLLAVGLPDETVVVLPVVLQA